MRVSAENIKKDLEIKLMKDFADIEAGSYGIIKDYDFSEFAELENITISWQLGTTQAYSIDSKEKETNIINFLEIQK